MFVMYSKRLEKLSFQLQLMANIKALFHFDNILGCGCNLSNYLLINLNLKLCTNLLLNSCQRLPLITENRIRSFFFVTY